ncbi:ferredoxin--NADP reductase [Lysobacter pythonis]|uniref:Ferredoxin--NADP reductase n=1 Tax=Solilutibacter pythonis TaxID=2483112 RepID=A0A3M2I0W9_9GAMM|nr:FAD-binding oxidoreductase [Lysobacter pythonis]RMH93813.1 ferredoxin--NADP reductase [Lysobacter pythonis]
MSKFFPIRLTARRSIAPAVLHLSFVRDDGQPLDYTPGQFIQIHFPLADGTLARRSYSCATRHDHHIETGEPVEFIASCVPGGAATALFQGMAIGESVQASGPLGLFTLKPEDANARYLLVATGTGIASYRSMLPDIEAMLAARAGLRVVVVHGARTPADALFADEFAAFAARHGERFRYLPCFSRALPADDWPHGADAEARHGYVQGVLEELAPDAGCDIAYLCGNPNMVDACVEALKGFGLPMKHIRREKYVSLK